MMESSGDYIFAKMIVWDGRKVRAIQLAAKRFPVLNDMCLERDVGTWSIRQTNRVKEGDLHLCAVT